MLTYLPGYLVVVLDAALPSAQHERVQEGEATHIHGRARILAPEIGQRCSIGACWYLRQPPKTFYPHRQGLDRILEGKAWSFIDAIRSEALESTTFRSVSID